MCAESSAELKRGRGEEIHGIGDAKTPTFVIPCWGSTPMVRKNIATPADTPMLAILPLCRNLLSEIGLNNNMQDLSLCHKNFEDLE